MERNFLADCPALVYENSYATKYEAYFLILHWPAV